jgi:hypothetical protein
MIMALDIDTLDISKLIVGELKEGYGDLKKVPSKMPAMDRLGETTWYDPGEGARALFQSLRVQVIWDVEIKNFFNRKKLDRSNSFIITLMPDPSLPLPLYAADVDVHKGKYVHIITDLIPLSKDGAYRKKYEEPVRLLGENYRDLPGMIHEITDDIHKIYPALRQFETFTSTGRIFGNVPVEESSHIIDLLGDYARLYSTYVKASAGCELLTNESIQKEAQDTLRRFMGMMAQFDFSEDMPNAPKRAE